MNWSYLFKHWFGTLLIAPIISQIIEITTKQNNQIFPFFEFYYLYILVGLLLSTPTYVIYFFIFWLLDKNNVNRIFAKFILILFTISGIVITFLSIGNPSFEGVFSYCFTSLLLGLILKLEKKI